MTILTATLPKQNLQARTTAGILNIVRVVGTGAYVLAAVIAVIVTLISIAQPNTSWTSLLLGMLAAGGALVAAALFYAIVGWFVDTLSLLTQIARNSAV